MPLWGQTGPESKEAITNVNIEQTYKQTKCSHILPSGFFLDGYWLESETTKLEPSYHSSDWKAKYNEGILIKIHNIYG